MADGQYYKDVREHLKALDERGKLVRVKKQINKDTQLMPLVRWQFRGLQEHQRKAFLFENVIDVRGKRYDMPVAVGTLAASTEIYAIGLNCAPDQIHERWTQGQMHPIAPVQIQFRSRPRYRMAGRRFVEWPWIGHAAGANFNTGV